MDEKMKFSGIETETLKKNQMKKTIELKTQSLKFFSKNGLNSNRLIINVYCPDFLLWGAKLTNNLATVSLDLSWHLHQIHASYRLFPASGIIGIAKV